MRDREPSILNRTNCAYSGTVVKGKQSGEILRFLHQHLRSLVAALHHGLLAGREVRSHGGSELRLHLNSHLRRRVDNRLPSRVGITVALWTFDKCNATMSQFCQVTKNWDIVALHFSKVQRATVIPTRDGRRLSTRVGITVDLWTFVKYI